MKPRGLNSLFSQINKHNSTTRVCIPVPPFVNSNGVWQYIEKPKQRHPLEASLPRLEFQIIAIFSVTQASYYVLKRLRIPMFAAQMIAGLILRQVLDVVSKYYEVILFSYTGHGILDLVAKFGYILFMFLMGVKMDVSMIHKTGKRTLVTGVLTLFVPFLVGLAVLEKLVKSLGLSQQESFNISLVVLIHSLSPFPVVSCLINDLNITNSELGRLGLSCAFVCDILGVILQMSAVWIGSVYDSVPLALQDLALMGAYVFVLVCVIRPAMLWVVKQTPEGKPIKSLYIHYIIFLAFGSAYLSDAFGQYVLLGPFLLGLAVPVGPPLGAALVHKLDPIVSGLLIPVIVSTSSMRADLLHIKFGDNLVKSTAILVAVLMLAKFAAALVPLLFCKVPKRDAFALALIMISKGVIEITTYNICREAEAITEEMFGFLIAVILVTAIFVPILVKFLYDPSRKYAGYQKRNIMHSEANGELRILACIYRPDNIPAIINFLQASCTTTGYPLTVYVLHLINLCGRAVPIFISHKLQKKTVSNRSYSENVILSFKLFEEQNCRNAYVHPFTAISPPKLMDEDICMLALDKLASIVVLPFHRQWFIDGSLESDDSKKRSLNCCVLERAPCSVGILIDRGSLRRFSYKDLSLESSFHVAMIFFGGSDDREALTVARRMSKNDGVAVTVIRFIARSDDIGTDWEKALDSEVLKNVKTENNPDSRVNYVVEWVNDGTETLSMIQSVAGNYDLIIVGRRNNTETAQTSGLNTLREFPELGIVGDFLVKEDLPRRYSVLVVQQQQITQ